MNFTLTTLKDAPEVTVHACRAYDGRLKVSVLDENAETLHVSQIEESEDYMVFTTELGKARAPKNWLLASVEVKEPYHARPYKTRLELPDEPVTLTFEVT